MKWVLGVLSAILLGEAVFAIATTPHDGGAPSGSLQVVGTALTLDGKPVRFNGISYGWHNLWPRFYNEGSVQTFGRHWGCRIVRAAIGADGHALADNPDRHSGYMDESWFALERLFSVADAATAEGIYVIVDWHSHCLHAEAAAEFFGKVAERYADNPYVIYELFNEPVSRAFEEGRGYVDLGDQAAMEGYWAELKEYAQRLIDVIVSASRVHPLILMGCPCWDQRIDLPAANPVEGYDNLMYTVHFYAATHKDDLMERSSRALEAGLPLFVSECAACEASGDGPMDAASWEKWNGWLEENGVSAMAWSVSDKDETCSMFTPEASDCGPWNAEVIKEWGAIVKNWIK